MSATPAETDGRSASPLDRARPSRVDMVALVVAGAMWVATATLLLAQPQVPLDRLQLIPTTLTVACGAVIVVRTETRLIGWLLVVAGVLWPLDPVFFPLGPAPPPSTPWNELLLELGSQAYTCLVFLLLVFPTGRFDSRLARIAGVIAAAPLVFVPLRLLHALGVLAGSPDIPFGIRLAAFAAVVVLGLTMQVSRYRHRPRVEQLQIKWFLLAAATFLAWPLFFALGVQTGPLADAVITSALPLAVLVAITRYRLYEIDRIISRTVAYALVIATLAVLGVGGVTVVTSLLPAQDRLAVALSTVAVVALFDPLRRRVVNVVDRRFDRTRYVARQVVDEFGRDVRDVTDPDEIGDRVHVVIGRTVAPTTVAVWQPRTGTP
ncbi:MAG TPA: hypothetical protein VJ978_08210 [Nitriliruptoraceae bacterium]|nr:hypothetical protein [Nitriliruptoraceae bacterium]